MRKMDDKPTPKVNCFTFIVLSARIFAGMFCFFFQTSWEGRKIISTFKSYQNVKKKSFKYLSWSQQNAENKTWHRYLTPPKLERKPNKDQSHF